MPEIQLSARPVSSGFAARRSAAEGSSALLYRLAYANAQQLLPYSQARWSQPPAQLLQQALRERLGRERIVLSANQAAVQQPSQGRLPSVLRVQLEEFSQVFSSAQDSAGVVRLRVVLADAAMTGETLVAQQVFVARRPAPSAAPPAARAPWPRRRPSWPTSWPPGCASRGDEAWTAA